MIIDNLKLRNVEGYDLSTVKHALAIATHIVFVCEGQRKLYNPTAPSSVIYAGVPMPAPGTVVTSKQNEDIVFLVLGIVCPRKNQVWAVELFKKLKQTISASCTAHGITTPKVSMRIVGARYERQYERDYLDQLKNEIADDPDIQVYDVTDDVEKHYLESDVLLFPSLNEVTPLVILEAMSYGLPVISTNIGGIAELMTHGTEGYLLDPFDVKAVDYMTELACNPVLRSTMGMNGKKSHEMIFDTAIMVKRYQQLFVRVAPPIVLIDMDGMI